MSAEVSPIPVEEQPAHATFIRPLLTSAAATLLVAGCTAHGEAAPSHHAMPAPTIVSDPFANLPDGYCTFPLEQLGIEVAQTEAADCQAAESSGTVAVVNFGYGEWGAELAKQATKLVGEATDGIVHLTPTVLQASAKAQAELAKSLGAKHCVDTDDPSKFAAAIAAETMPETSHMTIVQALVPYKPCQPDVGGIADGVTRRLSDVYLSQFSATVAPATIQASAHEMLHNYGLGHAGTLYFKLKDGHYTDFSSLQVEGQTDLSHDIQNGYLYSEYDGGGYDTATRKLTDNVMGGYPDKQPAEFVPTPMQLNELLWPVAAGEGKFDALAEPVTATPTSIGLADTKDQHYFTIRLAAPITLKTDADNSSANDGRSQVVFDELAIVPDWGEDADGSGRSDLYGAELYLTNESAQSADAGPVNVGDGLDGFTVGNKRVTLRNVGNRLQAYVRAGK